MGTIFLCKTHRKKASGVHVQTVSDLAFLVYVDMLHLLFSRLTGMPKEKYDPPDPRRLYTIMSAEEAANGKKSHWAELEITG